MTSREKQDLNEKKKKGKTGRRGNLGDASVLNFPLRKQDKPAATELRQGTAFVRLAPPLPVLCSQALERVVGNNSTVKTEVGPS